VAEIFVRNVLLPKFARSESGTETDRRLIGNIPFFLSLNRLMKEFPAIEELAIRAISSWLFIGLLK